MNNDEVSKYLKGEQVKITDTDAEILKYLKSGQVNFTDTDVEVFNHLTNGKYSDINIDYINKFLTDTNGFLTSAKGDYTKVGYSNAASMSQKYKNTAEDLKKRAQNIKGYLNVYKGYLTNEQYNQILEIANYGDENATKVTDSFKNIEEYFSMFETENDYNSWIMNNTTESDNDSISARQNAYAANTARVQEINSKIEELKSAGTKMSGFLERGGFGAGVSREYIKQDEIDKLKAEKEQLESANRIYERFGRANDEIYTKYLTADDFEENSGYASRNELLESWKDPNEWDSVGGYQKFLDFYHKGPKLEDHLYTPTGQPDSNGEKVADEYWRQARNNGWYLATENEYKTLNYVANTQGDKAAQEYFDKLSLELSRRRYNDENKKSAEEYKNADWLKKVGMNIEAVGQSVIGTLNSGIGTGIGLLTDSYDPYDFATSELTRRANATYENTANELNELTNNGEFLGVTLGDAYQAGMSGVSSAAGALMFGSAYPVIMGMGAAADTAKDLYERGASEQQMALGGVLAGTAEMVFEKVSIEYFLKNFIESPTKNFGQWFLKSLAQRGIEMSEEIATELANIMSDTFVMGDQSEWAQLLENYKSSGCTDSEAISKAIIDMGGRVWKAGAGGFISGGAMSDIAGGISLIKNSKNKAREKNSDVPLNTNAVTNPIESYPVEKQSTIKSFINAVDGNIKSFVQRVKSGDLSVNRQKISDVTARAAADIKKLLGIDAQGYTHNINTNGIQHILKRHGANGQHDTTMSSDDDIARVGWVLENYDSVEILTKDGQQVYSSEFIDSDGKPAAQIMFTKKINGTYYVVEAAFENERNKLWVQSTYLTKNKEDVTQTASANNDRDTNARSASASPSSNNTVPRNTGIVNNNISQNGGDNSDGSVSQSGARGIGLSEPSDQEIYRDSTAQENEDALFGKRKNAKQRHIIDVAKKLDSNMKVVFVSEDADVLSGQKGVYMRDSNTIYLSEKNSAVESYYQVFKHEFIHRLETKGAYQSMKNYLFRNSSSFERYVYAQLKFKNGQEFKGTREEALRALAQMYIDTVQKGKFSQDFKNNFTEEDAQREMVADFISEVLFKGNRADVAQHLSEGNLSAILDIEDTLAEFENLTKSDRNWFQKIIDTIRDFIAGLKGVKQNQRLVTDLEYIEQRLSRVLDSKDTKKAANQGGGVSYSVGLSFKEQLEQMKLGTFDKEHSHLFVRADTPSVYLNLKDKKIPNLPIVMSYDNAAVSLFDKIETTKSDHNHGLGVETMSQIPQYMEEPSYIVLLKNGRINALLTKTDKKGRNFFISLELEVEKPVNKEYSGGYKGKQHLLLTAFGASKNYFEKILNDKENKILYDKIKDSESRGNPESNGLNIINDSEPMDIIDQKKSNVKNIVSENTDNYSKKSQKTKGQFSLGSPAQQMREYLKRYESGEITREEYLEATERLWGEANEAYGIIPQGEKAKNPIAVPQAVDINKPTQRFVRTIIETGKLTDEMLEGMEEKILLGDFSYTMVSDEKAIKKADVAVNNGTAEDIWENAVNGKSVNKNQIAIGERLLKDAMEAGDTKRVLELSAELADAFTRSAQVVQAARLLKKMTGLGRLVSAQRAVKTINRDLQTKYGEDFPPVKISPEAAKRLAEAKTEIGMEHAFEEIMYEVAEQMPVTFLDKWNAWRYFAMLSNPKTHIRNVVGNAIFVPAVRIRYFLAAVGEQALSQDQRTKSVVIKKEYKEFAKKDAGSKEVINLLKGNKYNDKTALREKQRIFKSNALEFLTRFNSDALEAEDMLFKNKHYIHALAGFLQARNVDLNTVSQDVIDEARNYAVEEAKKATFTDESALANWIQNFGNKNLLTNMIVESVLPFKRTPINIVKRGIEYSPIGLTKTLTKGLYDVKKGNITVNEFIDGLASGLTGTGIMLVGMFLASMGCITGGEDDDDESKFEKLLGKQEYAVEIFGKSYTIDWAAPANIPFFIGVEIVNTINEGEEFSLSKMGNIVWNCLEPITNLSMLSGMQSVIESARYADSAQTLSAIVTDALTTYGMQVVPSLFGAVARTINPTQRSWYTDKNDKIFDAPTQALINNIKSKIPGLSYTQIPKIDAWGREVSRGSTTERVLENFVSPGSYSEIEYNNTSQELKRIFKATDVDVFPHVAAKSFELDGATKYLTADEYVTYAKAKGTYSFDYVQEFMADSTYETLTDEEKSDVIQGLYEYANAKAKTTVSDYDLMKRYKTVTLWEEKGRSAVDYYISKAIKK